MKHLLLNHILVKIYLTDSEAKVIVKMKSGGWVELEPLPSSMDGVVMAMTIATEVLAGKFIIRGLHSEMKVTEDVGEIPTKQILLNRK